MGFFAAVAYGFAYTRRGRKLHGRRFHLALFERYISIPSPRSYGERVRVRGGGTYERPSERPPLIPTFSP